MDPADTIRGFVRRRRLGPQDADWPELWKQMADPPDWVEVAGKERLLAGPALAVVGTRRASRRGLTFAEGLAAELVRWGWVIVSGLARGIDGAAHRGALKGAGGTIAVLGSGLDHTYPACHRKLRRRIEEVGCLVSEHAAGVPPLRHHFPRRNRLIAGLCRGIVVVEAPRRSGALLTGYLALDYGREVFAVPGPVEAVQSRGCHHLLKEGAHLLEDATDLHAVLAPPRRCAGEGTPPQPELPLPAAGSPAAWILDRLDLGGVLAQDLADRWPGSTAAWSEGLVALELAGLIRRLPGGRLALKIWRPADREGG